MARQNRYKKSKSTHKSFAGIPRVVMENPDYISLGPNAIKLLLWFAYQYKGQNNGDLTASFSYLKERGFKSKGTLSSAIQELITANMIMQTRSGIMINPGGRCALYALTWEAIDECSGKNLEVTPTVTPVRKFSFECNKMLGPKSGLGSVQKEGRSRQRDESGRYISVQK